VRKITVPFIRQLGVLGTLILVGACATNPVSGRSELSLVSKSQEIEMGKQASAGDLQRVGEYPDAALQQMVRSIGKQISSHSERPDLPWEFHLLDDAAVNAFAYPGGFIFVTRGLLSHINSEAELAEVVGHEIGHVTAKHTVTAMSRQQLAQIGLVAGSVLSSRVAQYGDLLNTGASLLFLKFGRDDENQADALGFRYSLEQGYDVRESVKLFNMLGRLSGEAGSRVPEWQSTHPDPGNRVQSDEARLQKLQPAQLTGLKINRDVYLRRLNGMIFGENPRLGYFASNRFLHPDLRFQIDFPAGWSKANMPDAVVAQSQDKAAQFQLLPATGSPASVIQEFVKQQGITVRQSGTTNINGLAAATAEFEAATDQGSLYGIATSVQLNGQTYLMLGIMATQAANTYASTVLATMRSFRQLTDPAAINVQPARIEIVTLPTEMSGNVFVKRYPSTVPDEEIYIINGIDAGTNVKAGSLLKRVVGGVRN
jgi:predicted Zn-dependent protease